MATTINTRKEWLDAMIKISTPVLQNLADRTLHKNIPVDFHPDRKPYILLEALGRTICGMAPWLELELREPCEEDTEKVKLPEKEKILQGKYRILAREAINAATDPESPDYMNFSEGYGQALVDAAFLAHGIVRAPKQLYYELDERVQKNLVSALKATRTFTPFVSNWLLFSAMIEAALYIMGEKDYDKVRVEYAINMFQNWYVGDGTYGDGPFFHWDYYNSFVIHPMLVDILRVFSQENPSYKEFLKVCEKRAGRYAAVLEQLIGPDGTYPVVGRSVVYRFGAFQALSQAALQKFLPENLSAAQVRCALTAVIRKVMENDAMFDENGWLTPGVYGVQPDLAEGYISVGSLYLCNAVFLPLGLSPENSFWADPDMDWTGKKIWSGENVCCDHAMD